MARMTAHAGKAARVRVRRENKREQKRDGDLVREREPGRESDASERSRCGGDGE